MIRRDAELIWRPGRLYIPVTSFSGIQQKAFTPAGTNGTSTVTGNVVVVGGGIGEAIGINPDSNAGVLSKAAATNRTIPLATFLGGTQTAGAQTFTGTAVAADTLLVSAGTTNAPLEEINSLGIMGLKMNTDGMEVNHYMMAPYDLDPTFPVYVRVHWTCGSTDTADTVLWKVRYLKVVPNTTELISAATALDTVLATDTVPVATAYVHAATAEGIIDPRVTAIADNVEFLQWEVEMDTKDTDMSEDLFLLGLELRYTPKRLAGVDGMKVEAKAGTRLLSKEYPN